MREFANVSEIFDSIEIDGLLVGNNAEWAREAVHKAEKVDLDYWIPVSEIDELIRYFQAKCCVEQFNANFGKVAAYNDVIEQLVTIKGR